MKMEVLNYMDFVIIQSMILNKYFVIFIQNVVVHKGLTNLYEANKFKNISLFHNSFFTVIQKDV